MTPQAQELLLHLKSKYKMSQIQCFRRNSITDYSSSL
jgi:hypothetical protein